MLARTEPLLIESFVAQGIGFASALRRGEFEQRAAALIRTVALSPSLPCINATKPVVASLLDDGVPDRLMTGLFALASPHSLPSLPALHGRLFRL
jgi:hypothetical protein